MKKIIRLVLLYIFALVAHQYFWQNLGFNYQLTTIFEVAVVLTVFEVILKPVIKILTLPINILTLGLFRLVINTLGLYLAIFLIDSFSLANINRPSTYILGFQTPTIYITGFISYLTTSISLSFMLYIFNQLLIRKIKK